MTDIESKVRATLRAAADEVPVAADLGTRAVVRAVRIRRNRRIGAVAGVAAAVLAALLVTPLLRSHPQPPPEKAATVGADPDNLHFAIDETAAGGRKGTVQIIDGRELVRLYRSRDGAPIAYFIAAPDPALIDDDKALNWADLFGDDTAGRPEPVTINGRPGTIVAMSRRKTDRLNWRIRWQPRPGMFMRVDAQVADRSRALAIAAAVRPDQLMPCPVPFEATYVPPGYRRTGCQLESGGLQSWERDGDNRPFWISGDRADPAWAGFVPNITVDGMPAQWDGGSTGRLVVADLHGMRATVQGLSQPEAIRVVRGLTVAADLTRPETWPR